MLLGGLAATGCGKDVRFSDSVDLKFDLLRRHDHIHSPYVLGASLQICADSRHKGELQGTELQSSDPTILRISNTEVVSDDEVCADAEALAVGSVDVIVDDGGDSIASTTVEVRAPDRVKLFAAGPRLTGRHELDVEVAQPEILADGTATFLVQYFDGDTRLYGNGALRVPSTDALGAERVGTVLGEDREWLRLTPHDEGRQTLQLSTPAGPISDLKVDVVGEDAIADVSLHGSDESGHEAGDALVVYAQAVDPDDAPIFGVEYEWSLGGDTHSDRGDLFRYDLDPKQSNELVARRGDLQTSVEISAGEGTVDSSNNVGCSIGGRQGGAWALAMLVLGTLARRRRR